MVDKELKNEFRDQVADESVAVMAEREQKVLLLELRARKKLNERNIEEIKRSAKEIRVIMLKLQDDVSVLPRSDRKQFTLDHIGGQLKALDEQVLPEVPPKDRITLTLLEAKFAPLDTSTNEQEDEDTSEELKDD